VAPPEIGIDLVYIWQGQPVKATGKRVYPRAAALGSPWLRDLSEIALVYSNTFAGAKVGGKEAQAVELSRLTAPRLLANKCE
jgi:hypothetical protein